jgi:2-hydroxy-3-keto-5-methylthiopentenyl-1-phosphate phosphatase
MIKAFIDFDGTITTVDVGDTMFETFGGMACVESIEEYRNEKISALECFRQECFACGAVNKNRLDTFLDNQPIDKTFAEFIEFCTGRNIECTVLSDGMDYYIERILHHNGLPQVRYYANHLDLKPMDGSGTVLLQPSFPHTDETCDRCACCKRNYILTHTADEDIIIYVGEGYSDRCPVRYADIVFAKDELLNYCRAENISYFEYTSFRDVADRLALMLDTSSTKKKSSLHKRRQAQLACREVYLAG